jgi:uncharacterized OB-fold protein
MSQMQTIADWTVGKEGIAFQVCSVCSNTWYFKRRFCPRCGANDPEDRQASGLGTVHAVTLVTRAPSEELRAYTPYAIVLVDADEGFRLMAHGDKELDIGERVRCRFDLFAGKPVPHFQKVGE